MTYNARAWIVWIIATAILVMVARNPLYSVILILLSLTAVNFFSRQDTPMRSIFLKVCAAILLFTGIYHALFIHVGAHVLFELPDWPLIGGPITLEALIDGARNGLVLIALLAVFMALNTIVPTRELVRLAPSSFQDLGVVVLIAITYVPETRRHLVRIREAQAIRGHQPHGLRDWRPLLIPLLVGGLERAMRLSEALVARGYVTEGVNNYRLRERIALVAGLFLALAGWLLAIVIGWPGYLLMATGAITIFWLIFDRSRRQRRTRYAPVPWKVTDTLMIAASLVALALVLVPWPWTAALPIGYNPYPEITLPAFQPIVGLSLVLMAIPVLLGMNTQKQTAGPGDVDQETSKASREELRQAQ
jgi:energy-coupling factor transport system permease protein